MRPQHSFGYAGRLLAGVLIAVFAWTGYTTAQAPPPAAVQAPRLIRVTLEQYKITPAVIPLKSRERVRLQIQNVGTVVHEFRSPIFRGVNVWIRTAGFDVRMERFEVVWVRPGAVVLLEFSRRTPGEYPFYCGATTSEGRRHRDLGMIGKFVVSE